MSIPKSIDYLTRLPPELLEDIFDQVQHSSYPLPSPLSQSLFPFQQKPLFRTLTLTSYDHLGTLCDYVKNRPQLAAYTETLNLQIRGPWQGGTFPETEDPPSPSNECVKQLFANLACVTSLVIAGSDRIARLVLDHDVATISFPNLRLLTLSSTFSSLRDPFHPASYESLQHYNELRAFQLIVRRGPGSMELTTLNDQTQPLLFRTKIDKITLSGPLSATPTSVNQFINSFVPLYGISLRDTWGDPRFYDFLDHIPNPEVVKSLALECQIVHGTPSRVSLVDKLKNFPNLSELELGGTVSTVCPSLYTSLRSLPLLHRLAFSESANVSLEELGKVISGPEKLKSLGLIIFNNVEGVIGTRVCDVGPYRGPTSYWNEEMRESGPHPDWILPDWSLEFSEEGLKKFMKDAAREGVKIEGSAVKAIGVMQEWEEEAEEARDYYTKKFIVSGLFV